MPVLRSALACAMALLVVFAGATHPELRSGARVRVGAASLFVKASAASKATVLFIRNPSPMPADDMKQVNVTAADMERQVSDGLTFYAFPKAQDIYVSGSITPTGYFEKDKSDNMCEGFGKLGGKADFLDVGANIGTWTIPMARCLQKLGHGGSVIAVEAMPLFAKHLAASIHANGFGNIKLFNYAVGDGGSVDQLLEHQDSTNKGGSYIDPTASAGQGRGQGQDGSQEVMPGTAPVYMTTLDEILKGRLDSKDPKGPNIYGMKIDIENFEYFAFKGATQFLKGDNRPCVIQAELRVGENEPSTKAMQLLKDAGYEDQSVNQYDHFLVRTDFEECVQRFSS